MGCLGIGVDPEIAKILASLDSKVEEYKETFEKEVKEVKEKQEKQLEERHDKLAELKEKKVEITEKILKDLNKKELLIEIDFLSNEVNKMHYIFDLGLELSEPLRKVTLDKLLEKAKTAPAIALKKINSQIEEIKSFPLIDFLNSTYGKVLKDALVKKGMSATLLNSFKKQLFKERGERRKKEREEFNIKVNEFKDEKIDDIKLDLFSLVEKEYKSIDKLFKNYCRDKIVEGMCEINNAFAEEYKNKK